MILEKPMITENIARDIALLMGSYMPDFIRSFAKDLKNTDIQQLKRAKSLWHCIKTEFERFEISRNIAIDLEVTPNNEIVQAIFRHQLSRRLKQDDNFASDVEQILYVKEFKTPIELPRNRVRSQGNRNKVLSNIEIRAKESTF